MLSSEVSEGRASTGCDPLDAVLGGLYWGDNVVWQTDAVSAEPFYRTIAAVHDQFESRTLVSLTDYAAKSLDVDVIEAGPRSRLAKPADLLREIHRRCQPRGHRLIMFDSMEAMVRAWGAARARDFFARCCPMVLELGAIAYWSMDARDTPVPIQETVAAVTQCVLRVDERNIQVAKAEGRGDDVPGTVLHWHAEDGRAVLEPADMVARVAASLRALRRERHLSQHVLGDLAGVSASAISQVERSERGLSLATLVRLSSALGLTVDDLLHGQDPGAYRIGRRTDDPGEELEHTVPLLNGGDLSIDLVHLGPRESGAPAETRPGTGIVAVASGLVQVLAGGQTPSVRHGEVLVADGETVTGWRNLGQSEAELFWIVWNERRRGRFN